MLREYLYNEWRYNVAPKYLRYFEEWFNNLTVEQTFYYTAFMQGKKSPYV